MSKNFRIDVKVNKHCEHPGIVKTYSRGYASREYRIVAKTCEIGEKMLSRLNDQRSCTGNGNPIRCKDNFPKFHSWGERDKKNRLNNVAKNA